jgi:hypothetical protein
MNRLCWIAFFSLVSLSGCTQAGRSVSGIGTYPDDAQRCVRSTRSWLEKPKEASRLLKALGHCETTLKQFTNQPEVAQRPSWKNLNQLKLSLETAKTALADLGDAAKVDPDTGVSPVDSVKIVLTMVESDLSNEARPPAPSPQGSP